LANSVSVTAGAPFELPYTLNLADQEPDRWQLHRDLIFTCRDIIAEIKTRFPGSVNPFLDEILTTDTNRLPTIESQLADPP
jgi:hypothetical protein